MRSCALSAKVRSVAPTVVFVGAISAGFFVPVIRSWRMATAAFTWSRVLQAQRAMRHWVQGIVVERALSARATTGRSGT